MICFLSIAECSWLGFAFPLRPAPLMFTLDTWSVFPPASPDTKRLKSCCLRLFSWLVVQISLFLVSGGWLCLSTVCNRWPLVGSLIFSGRSSAGTGGTFPACGMLLAPGRRCCKNLALRPGLSWRPPAPTAKSLRLTVAKSALRVRPAPVRTRVVGARLW